VLVSLRSKSATTKPRTDGMRMTFWLIVEAHENWLVDRKFGYSSFGLPERKRLLAERLAVGDILLVYVSSGRSAFSGARKIEKPGGAKLGAKGEYDRAFPISVATSPIITLEEPQWVSVRELEGRVSFLQSLQGRKWAQCFRTSLRPINEEDATTILEALRNALHRPTTASPVSAVPPRKPPLARRV